MIEGIVVGAGSEGVCETGGCDGAGAGVGCGRGAGVGFGRGAGVGFGLGAGEGCGSGLTTGVVSPASPGCGADAAGVPELDWLPRWVCTVARRLWWLSGARAFSLGARAPADGVAGGRDATWGDCREESPSSPRESNAPRMISTGTRIAAAHAIRTRASPALVRVSASTDESPPLVPKKNSPRMISTGSRITAIQAICTRPLPGVNANREIPPSVHSETRPPRSPAAFPCAPDPARIA